MPKSFADLGVSEIVCAELAKLGFSEPFAIQNLVVEDGLAGHDLLAQSPTGSGKTLAFGIPMVDRVDANVPIGRRPCALVLAPTRELASQIVDDLRPLAHARALGIQAVYGGVGLEKQARAAAKAHIVVATPGRLEDLLNRRAFKLDHVRTLVLDEADRMLDMGFKPAVDRIVAQCPRERQTLFFSATLKGEAGKIATAYTTSARRHELALPKQDRSDIEHRFLTVEHEHKLRTLVSELQRDDELSIVFVRTKRGADRLVQRLGRENVVAVAMHGDKSQRQREKALARFEAGEIRTLVATDVAARGIDVENVGHVINFDPPEDRDAYVHRIGRTGRAGRRGVGTTFARPDEVKEVAQIAEDLGLEHTLAVKHRVPGKPFSSAGAQQRHPKGSVAGKPRGPKGPGGGARSGGSSSGGARSGGSSGSFRGASSGPSRGGTSGGGRTRRTGGASR